MARRQGPSDNEFREESEAHLALETDQLIAETSVSVAAVTPGYFATMRIRLAAGRDFNRLDLPDRDRVAIVNEAFVRALASTLPLVGSQIQFGRSALTVIGIVEDTPDTSLRKPANAFVYIPLTQTLGSEFAFGRLAILARARSGDATASSPTSAKPCGRSGTTS